MIPIQPLLIFLLISLLLVYFLRFRSTFLDRLIVIGFSAVAILLVAQPELSNHLAARMGVARGVDLIFYLAFPGLLFMILLLYAKTMRQEDRVARLTRELALLKAARQTI